jgi:hypothetical protein
MQGKRLADVPGVGEILRFSHWNQRVVQLRATFQDKFGLTPLLHASTICPEPNVVQKAVSMRMDLDRKDIAILLFGG